MQTTFKNRSSRVFLKNKNKTKKLWVIIIKHLVIFLYFSTKASKLKKKKIHLQSGEVFNLQTVNIFNR